METDHDIARCHPGEIDIIMTSIKSPEDQGGFGNSGRGRCPRKMLTHLKVSGYGATPIYVDKKPKKSGSTLYSRISTRR